MFLAAIGSAECTRDGAAGGNGLVMMWCLDFDRAGCVNEMTARRLR